jgi:integrase
MRGKGEGSVHRRSQDERWVGTIELVSSTGKRRRKSVVRGTKTEAQDALTDMLIELRKHGDLPTASQTVEQWFEYWLETLAVKEVRPNTIAGYRTVTYGWIIPIIGTVKLSKLTQAHVRRVTDAILAGRPGQRPLSSTYALNAHRVMSSAFSIAKMEGRISENPAKNMRAPRKARTTLEALTLPEAIKVLQTIAQGDWGALWATYLLTGARRGEVIGLELNRVTDELDLSWQLQRLPTGARGTDGEPGKPVVPADYEYRHLTGGLYLTRPKSSRGWRVIPLVEPLKSILDRHIATMEPNPWGLLFSRPDWPMDPDQVSAAWQVILNRTGVDKRVRLHDVRHTTVDLLYEAGVPEAVIQEIVGHSTRSMTRSYKSRGNRAELEKAMTALSALFSETPKMGEDKSVL